MIYTSILVVNSNATELLHIRSDFVGFQKRRFLRWSRKMCLPMGLMHNRGLLSAGKDLIDVLKSANPLADDFDSTGKKPVQRIS